MHKTLETLYECPALTIKILQENDLFCWIPYFDVNVKFFVYKARKSSLTLPEGSYIASILLACVTVLYQFTSSQNVFCGSLVENLENLKNFMKFLEKSRTLNILKYNFSKFEIMQRKTFWLNTSIKQLCMNASCPNFLLYEQKN